MTKTEMRKTAEMSILNSIYAIGKHAKENDENMKIMAWRTAITKICFAEGLGLIDESELEKYSKMAHDANFGSIGFNQDDGFVTVPELDADKSDETKELEWICQG